MSITINQPLPTTGRLLKSTLVAAAIAGALLVTAVLPAEYGIDPTGIGRALGLTAPADGGSTAADPATPTSSTASDAATTLAEKAAAAFGANKGNRLIQPRYRSPTVSFAETR